MIETLSRIGFVALGSACGGVLRWGIGNFAGWLVGTAFPYGTFFINITGSLFLGWFITRLQDRAPAGGWLTSDQLTLMIAIGFTGGYTTFSSFEFEAHRLIGDGQWLASTAYIVGSVALGLMAVRLGVVLARM